MKPISLTSILTFLGLALFFPVVAFAQASGLDVPAVPDHLDGSLWGKVVSIIAMVNAVGLSIMKWAPSGWRTYMNSVMTALAGIATAIATSSMGASDIQIGLSVLTALISGVGPILMGIRAAKMLNPEEAAAVIRRAR